MKPFFFRGLAAGCLLSLSLPGAPGAKAQTFVNTTVLESRFLFPYPYSSSPVPSTPRVPAYNDFWYNNNFGGACYHQTVNFGGVDCILYLKGMNHQNIDGFGGSFISYNATPLTATDPWDYTGSGVIVVDHGDITEMQVGMYRINTEIYVVAAYYVVATGFYMDTWKLTQANGLVPEPLPGSHLLLDAYTGFSGAPGTVPPRISMDCSGHNDISLTWEHPGAGIYAKAFSVGGGVLNAGASFLLPSSLGGRLPDLAMSAHSAGGIKNVHLVYADPSVPEIRKYTIDFGALMAGTATAVLNDTEPISKFDTGWDEFQLRIDAPDYYDNLSPGYYNSDKWGYVYYNNDNSRIRTRLCTYALTPFSVNTYVVNDGSVNGPGGSMGSAIGTPLSGNAGAAFPAITFSPEGYYAYIGWYTTFDPAAATQTPLYSYNPDSKRYLGIVLGINGNSLIDDYNVIQDRYASNYIGAGIPLDYGSLMGYPKLCFSKHNGPERFFMTFASHDYERNMNVFAGASIYNYFESAFGGGSIGNPFEMGYQGWGVVFPGYGGVPGGGVSAGVPAFYMDQKSALWWSSTSSRAELFRTAEGKNLPATLAPDWAAGPNPFSANLSLSSAEQDLQLEIALSDLGGKRLFSACGSIAELNALLALENSRLQPGLYFLRSTDPARGTVKTFKLHKQ